MEGGESGKQTQREQHEPQRHTKKKKRAAVENICATRTRTQVRSRTRGCTETTRTRTADQAGAARSTMSESIRRKSSSKQLLQNLISLTAQRSQEDAEEVERERRRRARETQRGEGSSSWPEPPQHNQLTHNTELEEELKPRCCLVLEEDEGFSDWSHRLENRHEQEVQDDCRTRVQRPSAQPWKPGPEEEKQQEGDEEKQQEGDEEKQQEGDKEKQQEADEEKQQEEESERSVPPQESSTREKISRKEVRPSYSSTVFLSQDARLQHATGQPADRTSYLVAGTMRPRGGACRVDGEEEQKEEVQAALQREWRSAESRQQSLRDEDDLEEEEELSFTQEEKEDLHLRREEEHKMPDKRSAESSSSEENRRSAVSLCSEAEGEEPLNYGPMSPTFKKLLIQFYPEEVNSRVSTDGKCTIIERTESLRKSTSNIKKTPPVAVSKIDKKLEQYTHALEVSSREGRSASQDADGLKVGVADLINQWVRGSEDGSRCSSPSRTADMKAGGVLNKKNLWESFGDTLTSGREGKECFTGKRYKFVVTGHGKYEKVSVDDCSEDANCQAAGQFYEDL